MTPVQILLLRIITRVGPQRVPADYAPAYALKQEGMVRIVDEQPGHLVLIATTAGRREAREAHI